MNADAVYIFGGGGAILAAIITAFVQNHGNAKEIQKHSIVLESHEERLRGTELKTNSGEVQIKNITRTCGAIEENLKLMRGDMDKGFSRIGGDYVKLTAIVSEFLGIMKGRSKND